MRNKSLGREIWEIGLDLTKQCVKVLETGDLVKAKEVCRSTIYLFTREITITTCGEAKCRTIVSIFTDTISFIDMDDVDMAIDCVYDYSRFIK